jgi:ribosomal protein L24E
MKNITNGFLKLSVKKEITTVFFCKKKNVVKFMGSLVETV